MFVSGSFWLRLSTYISFLYSEPNEIKHAMEKPRVEQNADDDEDDAWLKELLFSHRADS